MSSDFGDILAALPPSVVRHMMNVEYLRGVMESHYLQPGRHYHTLSHVLDMVETANTVYPVAGVPASVIDFYVAILFHDLIYEVRQDAENERRSAQLAMNLVPVVFYPGSVNRVNVHALIMATTHRDDTIRGPLNDLIADIDLNNFAGPYAKFSHIGDLVAGEFIPVYGEEAYAKGRVDFLKSMLAKPTIFHNDRLFSNEKARENIMLEIERLTKQG